MAWHPFRNLGLKFVAVGLGTLLWLTVGSEHLVERSVRVPLLFRNVPDTLEILPDAPDSVEVHLRGRAGQLTGDQADVTVYIDLADGRPGSRLFHLRTDQVATPFGVEVTQVFPSTVMLTRPYSVTFAVCACAASGADSTPATARATSFLFMKSLLYRKKSAGKLLLSPAMATFSGQSRS